MDFGAEDLDELLRSLPEFFVTSLGKPDFFVTPTTVDEFSTTADKAAMIQASPPAALVVSLAQLPQLHGFIPRGAGPLNVRSLSSAPPPAGNSTMASTALYLCALVAHASALTLHAPARAPFALGRRTAALRMALPSAVEEFVPENVASDAAQMKQVDELWKVCAWHARDMHVVCTWHAPGVVPRTPRTPTHTLRSVRGVHLVWCMVHGASAWRVHGSCPGPCTEDTAVQAL